MKPKTHNTNTPICFRQCKLQASGFRFQERGFTVIELLVVIGIISIISSGAIIFLQSLTTQTNLSGSAKNISSTLNLAKSKTVSSESAGSWGAHFESDKFAIFKGPTYSAGDANTKIYNLPSTLELSSITLNGGSSDVLFTRITGQTSNYGSIIIREKTAPDNLINITIESSGQNSITTLNQPPSGARIADSRHIHFSFNGNTQNSATLLLSFPDYPSDNVIIAFQDFLSAGKDSFTWERSITVNGVARTIKISSHFLDSSRTDFSIQRERENNTEAMQVSLDGENLINYTAAGQESQGSSAWVTAPARQ